MKWILFYIIICLVFGTAVIGGVFDNRRRRNGSDNGAARASQEEELFDELVTDDLNLQDEEEDFGISDADLVIEEEFDEVDEAEDEWF